LKRLQFDDQHVEATTGYWITHNIDSDAAVVSNNSKILYYAKRNPYINFVNRQRHHRFSTELLLSEHNSQAFANADYLAFMVRTKNPNDLQTDALFKTKYGQPIQRFVQHEKQYVHLYKMK